MDVEDAGRWLPHEPPILMLDRVIEIEPGVSGTGIRRFEPGDPCFDGHFRGRPILPGVLAIEALAQTALVVLLAEHQERLDTGDAKPPVGYLSRVREMSFQRPIAPGQEVHFEVRVEKRLGSFFIVSGRVTHEGSLCAKGSLAVGMDRQELESFLGEGVSPTEGGES